MTRDMSLVLCDSCHVTYDFFSLKKCQKNLFLNAQTCQKVKKSFKKAGFHSIGATIRTKQKSRCFLYGEFFLAHYKSLTSFTLEKLQ